MLVKNKFILMLLIVIVTSCKQKEYNLNVIFNNVQGLENGQEVTSKGLVIGYIDDMRLVKDGVLVSISIDSKIEIGVNSRFIIVQEGLISGNKIHLINSTDNRILKNQDTIYACQYQLRAGFDNCD